MELNLKMLYELGLAIGKLLGYIVILTGILMTILILKTIFAEA